jgi:hypothetical protein
LVTDILQQHTNPFSGVKQSKKNARNSRVCEYKGDGVSGDGFSAKVQELGCQSKEKGRFYSRYGAIRDGGKTLVSRHCFLLKTG